MVKLIFIQNGFFKNNARMRTINVGLAIFGRGGQQLVSAPFRNSLNVNWKLLHNHNRCYGLNNIIYQLMS